ncbi:MAG: permease [Candidatus Eisenbacteria bacterium]|nr:permease [Candidatus Eisenbacteria bacterium]
MSWKQEWKPLAVITAVFLTAFYLPVGLPRFDGAVMEALRLAKWYAQEHVVLCLLPAFLIAGALAVFVRKESVMKYLGARAPKPLAYGFASVSGSILAVCSCTVLPLFAGIYRMGAGLGPATAFLYSGPAINVLAIILTARVLGPELGVGRAVGAVAFSVVIGLLMHVIFRKEELAKADVQAALPEPEVARPLWQNGISIALMVLILVVANWGKPVEGGWAWATVYSLKWIVTSALAVGFATVLAAWFGLRVRQILLVAAPVVVLALVARGHPTLPFAAGIVGLGAVTSARKDELGEWFESSWGFAKQILPLLLLGVLVAGILLGRPGHEGLIPSYWIIRAVGGNSVWSNLFASITGAFMYFCTLMEVPILQGLIGSGMGKGPALALLLAGPALSLPSMLVIRNIMGTTKTLVYVALVVVMATISGMVFGVIVG